MVVKTLFKTVRREIKNSLGRFMAIFAITALGVGFLAGLLSTAPDLYISIDTYYDNHAFMDFDIKSTVGFTADDYSALKSESYIDNAVAVKSTDVIAQNGENDDSVARIFEFSDINIISEDSDDCINKVDLVSGRLPENNNECIAAVSNGVFEQVELNTEITLKPESDLFNQNKLTVVGLVNSPVHMSIEKEKSSIGNGRVSMLLYTENSLFHTDYYSDIFITIKDAENLNTFDDEYDDLMSESTEKLEQFAKKRKEIQFDELKKLAVLNALYDADGKPRNPSGDIEAIRSTAEASIQEPEWYMLGRDKNVSFVSLTSNAEKVDSIAKVFPIFFFLVAALVALTTMTRMVDEQRTDIGTLKALGYSNSKIALKYLVYSGIAAVCGGIFGLLVGLYVLPTVIINAYSIMYRLPQIIISFNAPISVTALLIAIICIEATTLSAVLSNLREVPATLMLPKPPKSGKRILLESIGFLWNRMKFTHKVTARNIFRYKKRFFMTVLGICGCTALLLTGFGLKDAIGDIVSKQYNEIQKYNLTVQLSDAGDKNEALSYFDGKSEEYLQIHAENGYVIDDDEDYEINIYVPSDNEEFKDYMTLKERKSGKNLEFDEDSVIVTEKFAANHNIKVGSKIKLKNSSDKEAESEVTGICENYIYSYVYLSAEKYDSLFDEECKNTTLLVKSNDNDEDSVMTEILSFDGVSSAMFSSSVTQSFNNMIDKINYIVYVLIISAGLLAFVVLYNLTNINISERVKEIATIKVLGFYDGEVNSYIYRENFILSIVGTLVGLFAGIFLCRFVVTTAEVDMVMFGRTIYPLSFVLSAVITMIFTAMVSLFMARKLKKIDMVESMKSID